MLLRSLLILLACLSLAFAATPAQAAQVQLAWDAPLQANGTPIPNLAGYKLYYGSQSGQYPTMVYQGPMTTSPVTTVSAGQTYYFAVKAYDSTGKESAFSNEVRVTLPTNTPVGGIIPQQQMRVVAVDSQELVGENGAVPNALDGQAATKWVTEWSQRTAPLPHTLVLDLGAQYQVDGFRYLPRQDGSPNGTIAGYQFSVSPDGTTWGTAVAAGTLAADATEKTVRFPAKPGRYVRLVALSEMNGNPWTSAAELNVFGTRVTLPSLTLSALPATLASGQTATVTWAATNATTCAAPWTASTATASSQAVKPTTTTTYTMTCTGAGGTATASTVVTVTPKPGLTLSALPATLASGQTATVTWAATNATTCAAPWTASTATASSQAVKPTTTTTYTMTCTGAGGTATASTVVTVTPKPGLTLSALPATLASGQTATVTWAATNATTCAAPWTASTATASSQAVKPTTTTTYTMICTGAGGTATASTVVTVTPKPGLTLSALPATLASGQTATVTWAATNATTCAAPWTASTATASSQAVKPTTTTTYTMTCTGAGGTATASTVVTVTPKPGLTLSALPATLASGQTATVTWAATNATTCAAPWTASTATASSQAVKPTTTTTYTMTCTGAGGTATASTTVSMNTPVGNVIPQQQFRVVSVDSQELAGENGAVTNALDGQAATKWVTEWSQRTAPLPHTLVLDLGAQYQVDGFRYLPRQDGSPNGTMAGYQFSVSPDGVTWDTAVAAGTLAADTTEKTVRFPAKPGRYVRLVALSEINGHPWTTAAELNVFGTAVVSPPTSSLIPQQQFRVVSVDSQELAGENGAVTNALDGQAATKWVTEWSQRTAPLPHTLVLDLGAQYQVDGFRYLPRQDGSPNGTMAGYQFSVSPDGVTWDTAVAAGTLAADTTEKTVRFPAKPGRYVRLVALSEINGHPWTTAAELNVFGTAVVSPPTSSLIPQQQFRVVSVDSQELAGENGAVTNALDGQAATKWVTEWSQRTAPLPHTLVLDLGAQYQVDGFRYLPRQDGSPNGTMAGYQFSVSPDGVTWDTAVAAGTLAADTTEKTVRFPAKPGRYVRLVALSEINGHPWTTAAELNVFGTAAPSSTTTSSLLAQSITTAPVTFSTSTSTTTTGKSTTPQAPTTVVSAMSPSSTTTASQSSTKTASATVSSLTSSSPTMTVSQNTRWELTLTSTKTYAKPFLDVTVTVEYTKAGAPSLHGYGFWDGDATFKLRQAFPEPGTWHYKTTATDPSNSGLHNREGEVQVLPYSGPNPLYRHGFLQVSADRRFFTHADGTPFLWLGDTLWGATVWLTEAGFHDAVADRRAKHFTVLQTNVAHEDEVDTAGDTLWQDDRWNVRFMQKLDRMFSDANDQGMYLFVNGLVDLFWDRGIPNYERLVEMIGARYAAHFVSFASSMDDPYDPLHEQLNAAIQRTAPRTLVAQHPGATTNGQGPVWTAEQYYDTPFVDYVMDATGGEGDLEVACQHAIKWSLHLYNHVPSKPVINGTAWYEGVAGGTAEMTAQLGYLSLLSGNAGYTYGTSLWNATDADIPAWKAFRGATYMQYLYDFFAALDEGRPFQPRHGLIKNQATRYQDRMVLGVSADGMTYTAFLPKGGTISVDLKALVGITVGVTWYNPLTGQYHDQGTTSGGAVRSFVSPFGTSQSALVLMAQ